MLDVLRIVSSVDVGHDEFSTQALVKKHKDVAEEIGSYRPVIDALHEQSRTLPPEKADSEEVRSLILLVLYLCIHSSIVTRNEVLASVVFILSGRHRTHCDNRSF